MPSWLGLILAALFGLVAVHRAARRELPASAMAAGMAAMAVGMAGIGPHLVHGPWWAVGFAAIALWPPPRSAGTDAGRPTGTRHLPHLLGGVAMIYMCLLDAPAPALPDPALALSAGALSAAEHDHHSGSFVAPSTPAMIPPPAADGAPAALGWILACYFLLATVTVLTRRSADGSLAEPRHAATQAVMGFGTVIMLVTMT